MQHLHFTMYKVDFHKENNSCATCKLWRAVYFYFQLSEGYNTCILLFITFSNFRNSLTMWRNFGMMKVWRHALRGQMNTSWSTAHNSKSALGQAQASLKIRLNDCMHAGAALPGLLTSLECKEQIITISLQKSTFKMRHV